MTTTLICDCNQTMPLNAKALGEALHEELTLHTTLCRREAGAFQKAALSAARSGDTFEQAGRQVVDLGHGLAAGYYSLRLEGSQTDCLVVVAEPWSVENGFITPTFKVKRNRIEEVYGPLFEGWIAKRRPVVWDTA